MSTALIPVEEDTEVATAPALDVSIFEDAPQAHAVLGVDLGSADYSYITERSLDLSRMVWVTVILDVQGNELHRYEEDYYEIARRGPNASFY